MISNLCLNFQLIFSLFLHVVWHVNPISFFHMWLSGFQNTIYMRDYPLPIIYSCHSWKSVDHIYVDLIQSPLFCSIGLCICFLWGFFFVLFVFMRIHRPIEQNEELWIKNWLSLEPNLNVLITKIIWGIWGNVTIKILLDDVEKLHSFW